MSQMRGIRATAIVLSIPASLVIGTVFLGLGILELSGTLNGTNGAAKLIVGIMMWAWAASLYTMPSFFYRLSGLRQASESSNCEVADNG